MLYLIEILHQTTTMRRPLHGISTLYLIEILHQTTTPVPLLLIPLLLYLIEILHQTTTCRHSHNRTVSLYLIEILHQTTTKENVLYICRKLYLIEILHQTTTYSTKQETEKRCILSKFYIKPQPIRIIIDCPQVVSYRNSTSNHNQ